MKKIIISVILFVIAALAFTFIIITNKNDENNMLHLLMGILKMKD